MENLEQLQNSLLDRVAAAGDLEALESLRVQALGKKGEVTQRLKNLGSLSPDERREAGQNLNRVKDAIAEAIRSEEHTSELQSLMRTSYAVFCLKKKKKHDTRITHNKQIT